MNAAQFYEGFLQGWTTAAVPSSLKRLAGKTLKWKSLSSVGAVSFAFATNPKTAGLLPHLPGEFRLGVSWARMVGVARKADDVSWFQYTSEADAQTYASLQRVALEKFLAQPGKAALREIFNYSNDPSWLPRPNFDEFGYYFDATDASAWGHWYGSRMEQWLEQFARAPEGFNDWCWRVLWPNATRPA